MRPCRGRRFPSSASGLEVALHAFHEPACGMDLLARARLIDDEGARVVGLLAVLLEPRDEPPDGSKRPVRTK